MKKILFILTLFYTTLTWISPIFAAQKVEIHPHDISSPTSRAFFPLNEDNPCDLLEDLSMLDEFDRQNHQAEQQLNAKFDEEEEERQLEKALSESLKYYNLEAPQRIKFLIER